MKSLHINHYLRQTVRQWFLLNEPKNFPGNLEVFLRRLIGRL